MEKLLDSLRNDRVEIKVDPEIRKEGSTGDRADAHDSIASVLPHKMKRISTTKAGPRRVRRRPDAERTGAEEGLPLKSRKLGGGEAS